jgi:hypothetical protein
MRTGNLEMAAELGKIRRAVEALRLLIADEDGTTWSARQLAGVAELVVERLMLVERAARGTIDPLLLLSPYNNVIGTESGAALVQWNAAKQKEEAERELRRLAVEQRNSKRRRRR